MGKNAVSSKEKNRFELGFDVTKNSIPPIGIMTYGNADMMGMQWEYLTKSGA